ncbi:hypothetical protein RLEG12_33005 [Rhizobium leguminosarum bv. trifolii CB782]|nr:hypothetical protein RLEG12_33005 [Rhizobium leguminosarum bv. trifolii CB782]
MADDEKGGADNDVLKALKPGKFATLEEIGEFIGPTGSMSVGSWRS